MCVKVGSRVHGIIICLIRDCIATNYNYELHLHYENPQSHDYVIIHQWPFEQKLNANMVMSRGARGRAAERLRVRSLALM